MVSRPNAERINVSNFQSPVASQNRDLYRQHNWLCSHYERLCQVKFACCDKFWPCHHCHNNRSNCPEKNCFDTKMVECIHCNEKQQVTKMLSCKTILIKLRRICPHFIPLLACAGFCKAESRG